MSSDRKFDSRADALAASLLVLTEESAPTVPRCVEGIRSLLAADVTVACSFLTADGGSRAERLPACNESGERLRCTLVDLGDPRGASTGACPLSMATSTPVATLEEVNRALPRTTAEELRRSLAETGLGRHDAVRVLVAHDRAPLTCIAALRSYRFDDAERRGLERVAQALRQRMQLELRMRDAPLADAGLAAAMEAIQAPAFLLRSSVDVVHANALGRARLEAHVEEARRALASAWAGHPAPGVEVTTVRVRGLPDHALVVFRPTRTDVESRARRLATCWALTPRQCAVLMWLAQGASNKEIASRLDCAESTVEQHVTALLKKSGCGCRSALVAAFWMRE